MITRFVKIDLVLCSSSPPDPQDIEAQLRIHGEPLRWAITAIQGEKAQVEAVVLQN